MDKNKLIALSLLILVSIVTAAGVAQTHNHDYWHIFEAVTLITALLFYIPGALIAVAFAVIIGLIFLPSYTNYLGYFRLIFMGGIIGWFAMREKTAQEHMGRLLMVDRLTGLHNYSYFIDRLEEERQRADRFGSKLSLIMIDIDLFKPFNDKFGHRQGNELLIQLAKIFQKEVRAVDIVCRYGGEEFAIILPNTSGEAAEVAERIRESVANTEFPVGKDGGLEKITVSAGVACYPTDAEDELQLIDRSDETLYMAKQNGRNLVVVYGRQGKEGRLTIV